MFACAHPAIERGMRAPLMLQTILGLTAEEIAAAFLIPPATMGKRLVRAKMRTRDAGIPYQPFWAAKGHLLARTGAHVDAAEAYRVAIGLSTDEAVRAYLRDKLASSQRG